LEQSIDDALHGGLVHEPGQERHKPGRQQAALSLEAGVGGGKDRGHHNGGGGRGEAHQLAADAAQERPQGAAVLGGQVGHQASQLRLQAQQVSGPEFPGVQNGRKFLEEDILDIIMFDKEYVGTIKMECIRFKNIMTKLWIKKRTASGLKIWQNSKYNKSAKNWWQTYSTIFWKAYLLCRKELG
jgi:hypothetical protein